MARPSNTVERRQEIVAALQRVMATRGYGGATTAEIAQEAGLRQGLLHYHFKSKQEILLCLVENIIQTVSRRYQARLVHAGDNPEVELFAFIDAHVALGDDADPAMVASWVTIAAEAVHQEEVRGLYSDAIQKRVDELRRLIAQVLKSEGKTTRGAKDMASALAAAIEGSFQIAAAAPGVIPQGSAAKSLRAMALGLIAGAGS